MIELTSQDLERAIVFATEKHSGQVRKGDGRPYVLHPLEVLIRLHQAKTSKNMFLLLVAAILHDVVEDCYDDQTQGLRDIADMFGYHVAALVEELTLDKSKYETIGKKEYLAVELVKMSSYALCIKLVDRLVNIIDMKSMDEEFKTKYKTDTRFILIYLQSSGRKLTRTHKKLIKQIENLIQ